MLANLTDRIEILLESNSVMRIGLLFAARAFNPVVSLAFSLLAGMYLTVEDHGIYGLTLARIFVMQAFMEAGLQQSLVRFLAPALKKNDPDEIHSIIRASIQLKLYVLGAGVVATLVYILALVNASTLAALGVHAEWLPGARLENLYLAWLILTGGFALSLMTYLDSVLVSHESFVKLLFWLPMVGFLRLSLMGYFLIFNEHALRAEHIIYAFVIGTVIAVLFYFTIFYADFFFVKVPRRIWKPWTKRLLQFNTWIILASFMAILSDWMEVLLIDRSGDLGLFNAARLPMQGFMIILTTMVSFLLPRFARLESVSEYRGMFARIYQIIIPGVILFLPGLWIFPRIILELYGPEYEPSVAVFYILYPNFILRLYFAPLGTALFALDQPRLIMTEAALRMFSGIGLNLLLYPLFGINGAAWASLLAQCVGWSFLIYCYVKFFSRGRFPLAPAE